MLLVFSKKYRWYLLLSSLPWFIFVVTGDLNHLVSASFTIVLFALLIGAVKPVLSFFLNHGYFDGGFKQLMVISVFFMAVTAASLYLVLAGAAQQILFGRDG